MSESRGMPKDMLDAVFGEPAPSVIRIVLSYKQFAKLRRVEKLTFVAGKQTVTIEREKP